MILDKIYVFYTDTCPTCPAFKAVAVEKFDAENLTFVNGTSEEGKILAEKYSIASVPVLVIDSENDVVKFDTIEALNKL